jgi:uncharacterized membrane protein
VIYKHNAKELIMLRKIIVVMIMMAAMYGFCVLTSFADTGTDVGVNHEHNEHSGQTEQSAGIAKFIGWLGKFHPAVVHFPIALLIAAAVAEVLFAGTGKMLFDNSRRFCMWFGIIGAFGAGILGWFFAGFELFDENWLLTAHRWLGTSTVVCSLLLGWLAWQGAKYGRLQIWYRLVLLLAVLLVSATGFFGGAMIYGLHQYAW